MVAHLLHRRGAARIALIPPEVLHALNEGLVPTVNLSEFLALDLPRLARNVARQIGLDPQAERLQDTLAMLGAFKPMRRHGWRRESASAETAYIVRRALRTLRRSAAAASALD